MENFELRKGLHIITVFGHESILVMKFTNLTDCEEPIWVTMHGEYVYENDIKIIFIGES